MGATATGILDSILESITDEVYACDRQWGLIYLNDAAVTAVRAARGESLSRGEILGQNIWTMLPRHAASIFQQKCEEAALARKTVTFEAGSPQSDTWTRVHAYPFEGGLSVYCQDVTRQKQADAKQAYRAYLLDNVYDAVIATDEHLRVTFWNVAAERLYGWDSDEAVGRDLWDMVLEFSAEERAGALQTLAETGQLRTDATTRSKDGIAVHVEGNTIALRGESQAGSRPITGYLSLRRNIAEREDVENQLRRSEAHLAEVQRLAHIGSWVWHVSSGRLWWSLEHFHIFGLDPKTFIPTKENTQRLIHPDDLPFVQRTLDEAIRGHRGFEVDYRIIRPDGSIRFHHGSGRPAITKSADLEFVGTVLDVTERVHAEEQLRRSEAYLATGQRISKTATWAWNPSTGEIFWSLEHYRICGVDPASFTVTFESALALIHPDDRAAATQTLSRAVRDRQQFAHECRILRPDGTVREVSSVAHPSFTAAGELIEYIGTVMDVTERNKEKGARQELLRRLMVAQENERRRISRELHDAVGQHLSLLTLGLARLRLHAWKRALSDELTSLDKIVGDLDADLDFFVWQLRPTALDDLGLIGAIRDHVSRWSAHLGIRVDWHVSGVEEASLTGDIQITLYRLLQEALNNVAKHAEASHVDVLLERYGDHVSLIVEDDGIGFETDRLFGAEHTGLGLIGMRERAALVGGSVDIESHVGDGTTFVARIPIRGAAPSAADGH